VLSQDTVAEYDQGGAVPQFFVTITGERQGQFKGELSEASHTAEIGGLRLSMELDVPLDIATGHTSGKRQYQPITITKQWGAASPQILRAAATGETLKTVSIRFVQTKSTGVEEISQTIILTNATISQVRRFVDFTPATSNPAGQELEEVALTFQRIEIADVPAGTSFSDDWEA
jgi:type VI secretion system secreted protein Hcp